MQNIKDMRGKTLLLIMNAERRLQKGDDSMIIRDECRANYAVMIIGNRFLLSGIFSGPRLTAADNNMLTMKIRY